MDKATIVFEKLAQGYNGPGGQVMKKGITQNNGMFTGRTALKFNTPKGIRYYAGQDSSRGMQMALNKATMNARTKFVTNPADSMTTQQFNKFK